jgi:ATP-dependent Clp protease ATP-binding subunit ClpA
MFERYTEKARRVIFFARYEASQFGSPNIESEHLLLGILREGNRLVVLLGIQNEERIRAQIESHAVIREKVSTSVDLPLSEECKRILAYGAEEAMRLVCKYIGSEHLLLGILREKNCLGARILTEHGVEIKEARKRIAESKEELKAEGSQTPQSAPVESGSASGMGSLKLIEVSSAEFLLNYQLLSAVPRVGESIQIHDPDGSDRTFRVEDVIWEFQKDSGISQLKVVKLRVLPLG